MIERLSRYYYLLFVSLCVHMTICEKTGYDFGVWQSVSSDYNWNNRQNGITPEYWSPSFGNWKHYNVSSLLLAEKNSPSDSGAAVCINPEPWTQGRMVKNWIQINASASELWSMYEPSAVGHWPVNQLARLVDNMYEAHHIYVQTPFRITQLPGVYLPASVDFPEGHESSRVTVVQAPSTNYNVAAAAATDNDNGHGDGASYSGPRWLPTKQEAEILNYMQDQGEDEYFYRRWSFSELWLSEQGEDEKMGLFVQYHGLTGELLQLILMREQSLLPTTSPQALLYYNPDTDCDLDHMEETLSKLENNNNLNRNRANQNSPIAQAIANGESIQQVLELGVWERFDARIVQCKGLLGPEIECVVQNRPAHELEYMSPYLDNPKAYFDIRFQNGVYVRIPKKLAPEMDDMCFELGSLTRRGNFHRLMAVGSRSTGSIHTTVYERWSSSYIESSNDKRPRSPWGVDQRQARENQNGARRSSMASRDKIIDDR